MGRRILQGLALIVGLGDNLSFVDDYAPYGNFPVLHGPGRFADGVAHISFVWIKHSAVLSRPTACHVKAVHFPLLLAAFRS